MKDCVRALRWRRALVAQCLHIAIRWKLGVDKNHTTSDCSMSAITRAESQTITQIITVDRHNQCLQTNCLTNHAVQSPSFTPRHTFVVSCDYFPPRYCLSITDMIDTTAARNALLRLINNAPFLRKRAYMEMLQLMRKQSVPQADLNGWSAEQLKIRD